ncbi:MULTISPECIES: hypothetical protein [unclassified Mesorhizobium]|nr:MULTISPECIES: hypothetical protein [unclassified Mesorhizobium]RUW72714.1 hypothetical protein EOA31_14820 [Mesorhizobium sp. M4B.F.Ca.ET.049.02.1.2]RWA59215.1 MAG: hypothetical protein EOQ27_27410 [Mesorhizobium sp.]RWC89699.1 MAG: hypothetical protein EOS32_29210 [Mesorhizobium sp.]RWX68445.1 hypothetical protein EN780_09220 [Mesorhizobium sp. M4B.F.Ca.ET.089.01.1.1]TGV25096.1 hypothetical protein EN786_16835 [Mesorhizobium sp. M4B.F.Ca.ET.143.01.1.1]
MPMSMLGSLADYSRLIMRAHNSAKTRYMMDALPPNLQQDVGWQAGPAMHERKKLAQMIFSGRR